MSANSEATAESTADREMVSVRVLSAPRELVWKACTDPAHLAKWWGPNGFTSTFHEFDLKPGGNWRFVMHGPDGTDYKNHHVFIEIKPPERLVTDHTTGPHFRITMTFDDLGGGKTRLTFRGVFRSVAEYDAVKGYALDGNRQTLDRLEALLKTLS